MTVADKVMEYNEWMRKRKLGDTFHVTVWVSDELMAADENWREHMIRGNQPPECVLESADETVGEFSSTFDLIYRYCGHFIYRSRGGQ